ncbi:MAG: choline-sulfatase [Planctomycetota bacterium]|jgi:choline-sulfatase
MQLRTVAGPFLLLIASSCGSTDDPAEVAGPRSVLLVTIDTLRADHLGCYGYSQAETPNIDSLSARGVRFANVQTVAPITFVAHTSLMTGTIPPHHGVRDNASHRALPELTTLAEVLQGEGFRTGAFTAAFVLDSIYGLDQGFEVYGDVPQLVAQAKSEFEERPGYEVNQEAITWLNKLGKNEQFFLWVHYFEPHTPYPAPENLPKNMLNRPYDAEIAMADRVLGQLLEELRKLNRTDETLVVLTSDHGESRGEHGEETHAFFVYQGVLHIPLILAHPSLPAGRQVLERVSVIDVMPTILELLDVAPPTLPPPAASLMSLVNSEPTEPRPVYFESWTPLLSYGWAPLQGVSLEDMKYIRVPRSELYDLGSDPQETQNLHAQDTPSAKKLSAELTQLLGANENLARAAAARKELSADEREKLASLGYVGTAAAQDPTVTYRDPKDGIERVQIEQRIRTLLDAGNVDQAEAELAKLLRDEPKNPVFNAHLALIRIRQSRHAEAIPYLEICIANGLDNATTHSNMGTCQFFTEDYPAATKSLEEALKQNPKHLVSLFWLGRTHAAAGEKEKARARFEEILKLWGGKPGAMTKQVRGMIAELDG